MSKPTQTPAEIAADVTDRLARADELICDGDTHAGICALIYAEKAALRAGLEAVAADIASSIACWEEILEAA